MLLNFDSCCDFFREKFTFIYRESNKNVIILLIKSEILGDWIMTYQEATKKLRNKMILSQTEFAEELGVSFATVNRWETGKHYPTIKAKRLLKPYFIKYEIEVDE